MNNSKILIVDDEESILKLLTTVFKKEGFSQLKTISDPTKAIGYVRMYNPDLIILDIMMPRLDGFELLKEIRQFTLCPVLFLSAKNEESDKLLGLGLGADDYITKPFSAKEVVYRSKAHLRRIALIKKNQLMTKNVVTTTDFEIDFNEAIIRTEGMIYSLTGKELRLLKLLTDHANIILTKEQIIDRIWDDIDIDYDNTLMVHIRRIRKKLEPNPSQPNYIQTVKGIGYKFRMNKQRDYNAGYK